MHGPGKSDRFVLPEKPTNKEGGAPPSAEPVEGGSLTKGNPPTRNKARTQSRERSWYGAP